MTAPISDWRGGLGSAGILAQRAGEARETAAAEEAAQEIGALVEASGVAAGDRAAELGQEVRVGIRDRVGHFLGAAGRRGRRAERGENGGKRSGDQLLGDRLVDADRARQAADQLRRKKLLHETDKIDCHCALPSIQQGTTGALLTDFRPLGAPRRIEVSCGGVNLDDRRAKSYPRRRRTLGDRPLPSRVQLALNWRSGNA